jgi:type 1 glutamine amidotransferase
MSIPRKILLVSAGLFHPPLFGRLWLDRFISRLENTHLRRGRSLEILRELDTGELQALVLYYHQESISTPALQALDAFVSAGGGVLAIHSATASFQGEPDYFKILGGRFTGHGPIEQFKVEPLHARDSIFGEIPAFSVTDELYLHELTGDICPHFVVRQGDDQIPIVWTRQHGKGQVCYLCPGHRTSSLRHSAVQAILERGLAWVCGTMVA